MQQRFHWLLQLCWHIRLERRDHQVKIVMRSNRTENEHVNSFNKISRHFHQLTPDPIDDILLLFIEDL